MDAPFTWRDQHLAADFGSARVLFTTRTGGMSSGPYSSLNLGTNTGDDPANVAENRERVERLTGVGLALGRQVHEAHVHRADAPGHGGDADGQVTTRHGVACTVLTADCLPVALIAPGGVAMLHAGWCGLAAGVLEEGVAALEGDGRIIAAIGPGAGRCCYEVGDEVRAAFADEADDVRQGRNLDLPLIAERRLRRSGVTEVHQTGLCTMCDAGDRFFSHRRDGGVTGRQAGVAWLI
ncbi:MAG: polyphenol oxidase family protein [Actinomycetota bacterium]|nr:polyphenol oxidase family protein [Actinomycetota bacterium]